MWLLQPDYGYLRFPALDSYLYCISFGIYKLRSMVSPLLPIFLYFLFEKRNNEFTFDVLNILQYTNNIDDWKV